MVLQIATVSRDTPQHFDMLEKAYRDIYLPAFPIESERESLEKFYKAMNGEMPGIGIAINILGENLDDPDPEKRVLKGISIAYYYERHNVGLLAYNAIDPKHRDKGMGKLMVDSRIESLKAMAAAKGKTLDGVFIEVNDPTKVAAEHDSMDPSKRVAIFEDWGARKIPVDYVQPPLSEHGDYNDTMLLMNYPLEGKYASKETVEKYLRAVYREFRSDMPPDDDYFFRQMQKQLHATEMPETKARGVPGYKVGVPLFRFVGGASPA